ncbi:hypothetical protein AB4Z52_29420 [Rhizobium sp. 2YAF20]|uniref:hypothetical protein n=1 Tax=Rhizobium sp. 2YAF20 TaxID=3233027 RepID=UPI003F9D63BE
MLYEILANSTSMGIYEAADKTAALEALARDAGYRNLEEIRRLDNSNVPAMDVFLAQYQVREITIQNIRTETWEGDADQLAVYFTLNLDDEKIETLEWIDSDGDLETVDSHVESAHGFSSYVNNFIRDSLNDYIERNRAKIEELQDA